VNVVSLLPGGTELCCRLGVDPIAVSASCDYPPRIRDRPTVVEPRVDGDGSSRAIDDAVQEALEECGVFEIDAERLARLDPDLIVAQDTCDVCAVDRVQVRDVVTEHGLECEVLTVDVHSLGDLFATIDRLGSALDREGAAAELETELRERIEQIEARGRCPETAAGDRPRMAVLDWMDPPMVAGHWVPELVERAGGAYGLADTGERSRPREWTQIREYDPEILVVAPCGFDRAQTGRHLTELTERPGWSGLTAVRSGEVYLVDGDAYVNRPGPRLVETLEAFAAIVPGNDSTHQSPPLAEPIDTVLEGVEADPGF
jgi:iron complex transport system substrate-binding protein